jgi:lipopolysaccharide transport system ATP-binding protein
VSDIVINAENLGKKYIIGHQAENAGYLTLRDMMMHNAQTLWNKTKDLAMGKPIVQGTTTEEVWALKDVSFKIKRGDAVGIIGRNGAGKSTLLKTLSRITAPTTGRIAIKGRVASLLEVGTGFHPELTGRENIYLNGTILGMTRSEIKQKFDEIVAFAEVEKFLDTPVKRYSSGMYVRLAFAVAAHLEPEILVVDEVLAVGDAQFQKKCLGKMGNIAAQGRTILFVSHNMAAIRTLCGTGILLENGKVTQNDLASSVVDKYLGGQGDNKNCLEWNFPDDAPGNEYIRLMKVSALPLNDETIISIDTGIKIDILFYNYKENASIDLTIRVINDEGIMIFESGCIISPNRDSKRGLYQIGGIIPPHLLNAGSYKINMFFGLDQLHALYAFDKDLSFEIENTATGRGSNMSRAPGVIRPMLQWATRFLE